MALIAASGSHESADPTNAEASDGEREPDVAILPGPVNLASPVAAGDSMLKGTWDLEHPQTGGKDVDREPDLHAPASRQR